MTAPDEPARGAVGEAKRYSRRERMIGVAMLCRAALRYAFDPRWTEDRLYHALHMRREARRLFHGETPR